MKTRDTFASLSRKASKLTGSWQASIIAISTVIAWILGGFIVGFTDTYQLIINTGTTIITFIMVFLIQAAQNRDTNALHIKLDDLLCSIKRADDKLINIEDATDDEMAEAKEKIGPYSGGKDKP